MMLRSLVGIQRNVMMTRSGGSMLRVAVPTFEEDFRPPAQAPAARCNRVSSGVTRKKRHKKVIKMAKGFRGRAKNCYRIAKNRVEKSLQHAYVGRKLKKRDVRKKWIVALNAATREHGMNYSLFMHGLKNANVELNRKVLAELAVSEPYTFKSILMTSQSEIDEERLLRRNKHDMYKLYAERYDSNDDDGTDDVEGPVYTSLNAIMRN